MRLTTSAFIFSGLSFASCGDGLGGFLISNQQEVELGAAVDQQLRVEYRIATAEDPTTQWLVQFVAPLIEASRPFRAPENFGGYKVAVIVDDALVNAFAAPGGFTYISTGLILQASTCAEIAGVMGHELAHVTERHTVKKIEDTYAVSAITEWFLGDGIGTEIANGIYGFLTNTQFSQEHETESDVVGLQISFAAGYNPYGLGDFFEKLLALQGDNVIPEFLSSHPANADRVARVAEEIQKRYGGEVVEGQTQSYNCVGTGLTLEQLKAHIQSGQVAVIPGTGTGTPPAAEQPAAGFQEEDGEAPAE
jgi:predicted Zn-dependent protease